MKVSVDWLQTFFDTPLPGAEKLENALTFHSSEIEEVIVADGDTILDVKVLPDKSAWMLSHRGVAKEIATILNVPLTKDPLAHPPDLSPETDTISIALDTERCVRYSAALVQGVIVRPSPEWLQKRLAAIGQRSINNVVDATNYIMFHLGQPLHAYDAGKLSKEGGKYEIGVRQAHTGERIVTLTDDEYALTNEDMVIVDRTTDRPIGVAGVKGGAHARVDEHTTDLLIEAGNFDRVAVRKMSQRLKLRTDASARYENGVVPELTAYGLSEVVALITEIAGGTCAGYADVFSKKTNRSPVSVSLTKINSVLGLSLTNDAVDEVFARFGYVRAWVDEVITVTPPFERDDLVIAEDLIEEVGRIHGLAHIDSVTPDPLPLAEYNASFHYADTVRQTLVSLGFTEVFTSSFRKKDEVQLANALASDKGYMRSMLRENLSEALARNVSHKDLLGMPYIALFEIGTVFAPDGEHVSLAFGVRTGTAYSPKKDDPIVTEAITALTDILGVEQVETKDGIAELDLTAAIADLPPPTAYAPLEKHPDISYKPFSSYPSVSRDIALWVSGADAAYVESVLNDAAGTLRVRTTLFDEFQKDGRTSFAFRLVFQSQEKTLTDEEVNQVMDRIYAVVSERGWEVR